jgi:hypothetical protein
VQNLQNWTAGRFQRNIGASLQSGGEFRLGIYFSTDKVVDRSGALGPPWTDGDTDRGGPGRGGALTGARPPAAPVH